MNISHLLADKFISTKLPDVCAPRHALIRLFHKEALKRIIYVSAPAGYGKTVSTQLWLKHSGRIPLWIGLDEYDNTPSIFYKLFCTGVLALQPENKAMADILASPAFNSSPVEHTISLLSAFTPDDRQYAVVLDDMHLVTNEEIRKSALLVQKRLPSSFVVVILTRDGISEEYTTITGEEKCAVITAQDLAFSTEEIQKYFNAHGRFVTAKEAAAAYAITNGWAIGVSALAMSGQMELGQNGDHILGNYIKTQIWDNLGDAMRMFLLKTSVLDEITPELAEKLTGEADSRTILEKLCAGNMFTSKTDDECFRYHHLFLEFLRDILKNQPNPDIDVDALNEEAARYFYDSGNYYVAMDYYIRSNNHEGISESLQQINDYNKDYGVEQRLYYAKQLVLDKLPDTAIISNLNLAEMCSVACFLAGDAERFLRFTDVIYANFQAIMENDPALLETVCFMGSLDFRTPLHLYCQKLADRLANVLPKVKSEDKKAKSSSITQNLPFSHRSMRDFSEFANDTEKRMNDAKIVFEPLIGKECHVIVNCIYAGIHYERNQLRKAYKYALLAQEKWQDNFRIELRFCLQMILASVFLMMGRTKDALKIRADFAQLIEKEGAMYLRPNFLANETKIKLWNGDKQAAKAWLEQYFVTETRQLEFYKIFQHFTTARAYLVLAQTDKAMSLILKLKKLGTDFRRPLDIAEASVLQAVLEWAMGNKKEAVGTLGTVLAAMQEYNFVRVIADEGAAVLPILKKLALHLKKESYQGPLDAHFLNEVTITAYEQSKRYKGVSVNIHADKPVKLSKQQKRIITLLSKGYKNAEIVEMTGLTIHTVKSHQSAAYAKLDVNNAMDAVIKAKELGAIE